MTPEGRREIDARKVKEAGRPLAAEGYRAGHRLRGGGNASRSFPSCAFWGRYRPRRPEVKDAVERSALRRHQGGHGHRGPSGNGLAIAKELAIAEDSSQVVIEVELEAIGDPGVAYLDKVAGSKVFARVTPCRSWRSWMPSSPGQLRRGHRGRGQRCPAMRKANIGVAMGSGTGRGQGHLSIVVTDDNFASIVAGVEEGRYAYDNVTKITYLLVSTGAARR